VRTDRRKIGTVHVITDTVIQTRFRHAELARLAIAGGADTIQLRDKQLTHADLVAVARDVLDVCRGAGVPLIVNDSVEGAVEAGADGVHLGRGDAPIADARAALGPGAIIGGSAGSLEEARRVVEEGADYVGFGHVFPTGSKEKAGPPVGLDGLRAVCAAIEAPVIAIGGITAENAGSVAAAGAWGVAVVGAVCGADSPESAARDVRSAFERETSA